MLPRTGKSAVRFSRTIGLNPARQFSCLSVVQQNADIKKAKWNLKKKKAEFDLGKDEKKAVWELAKNEKKAKMELLKKEKEAREEFTNLTDKNDPVRDKMFQYHWGTWMKDDLKEKKKRITRFSLLGLNGLIRDIQKSELDGGDGGRVYNFAQNTNVLVDNIDLLKGDGSTRNIKRIISIHEGRHHHIYKIVVGDGKNLVLRLPYKLYPDFYTERCLKSEAATADYLQSQLDLHVPRVLAYSGSSDNPIKFPFMLTEYVEGDLLMKDWKPLSVGELANVKVGEELKKVIDPISAFVQGATKTEFSNYGSLYFKGDIPEEQSLEALPGNSDYVLGPTTLQPYYNGSNILDQETIDKYVGPWPASDPLKSVSDLGKVRSAAITQILENKQDDEHYKKALAVYKSFEEVSSKLINLQDSSIANVNELVKPRIYIPDIDPMNVIVSAQDQNCYFIDFEGSTTEPFLLTPTPKFVRYTGPKVFDTDQISNFDKMAEPIKEQYEYMQKRTRNQVLWEKNLVKNMKDLAVAAAPAVKKLREPFLQALEDDAHRDYLNLQDSLASLQQLWDAFAEDNLVGSKKCPFQFTQEDMDELQKQFEQYQKELSSVPFAATKGWVPQDIFDSLEKKGIIVPDGDGYRIDVNEIVGGTEPEASGATTTTGDGTAKPDKDGKTQENN